MSRTILAAAIAAFLGNASIALAEPNPSTAPSTVATATQESESARANQLFDEIFDGQVSRDPMRQTYLGIKTDYDKWTDISDEHLAQELAHNKADLERVKAIDVESLDAATKLSYELMVADLEDDIADYQWRYHDYPVNQMFGTHSQIPAFLINQHSIADSEEAKDYISRIKGTRELIAQLIEQLKIREAKGIIAPNFVLPHVIRDSQNILVGAPFDDSGKDSVLLEDFNGKVSQLNIGSSDKEALAEEAAGALKKYLQPAYQDLIAYLEPLLKKSTADAGVWKLPNGADFYDIRLKRITTTDLNAEQIHELGLSEVKRIHSEMIEIKNKVGFEGSLPEFMQFMREDQQFYYPNTDEGRQQYLNQATVVLDDFKTRLDSLFLVKPKADLIVKRVEPFREKSAGKAFYQQPSPDGSRPGTYYANLYDMSMMPKYQLEALAYHEGLPGHHMQIAIKQELQDIPKFRRFGGVTAYSEGWGLYSELLPKEIGLYQDPYSDFGRLSMELWRAVRLVVDSGMHAKGWTREESIEFYVDNTPNARIDAVKMVERHAVMPGQATAYKIGMLAILQEREKAKKALGDKFDIREFHAAILQNGALPMDVLGAEVDKYIAKTAAQ